MTTKLRQIIAPLIGQLHGVLAAEASTPALRTDGSNAMHVLQGTTPPITVAEANEAMGELLALIAFAANQAVEEHSAYAQGYLNELMIQARMNKPIRRFNHG